MSYPHVYNRSESLSSPFRFRFDGLLVENKLSKTTKSAIYAHVAEQFGMKRKTLVTKVRKLKELKDDSKLEPMLIALKDGENSLNTHHFLYRSSLKAH